MLVLFETPAGYAIFKLLDEAKLTQIDDLYQEFNSPEGASAVVKLKNFVKFEDTTEALAATTAIIEGKISKPLKKALKKYVCKEVQDQFEVYQYGTGADNTLDKRPIKREHSPTDDAAPSKKIKLEDDGAQDFHNDPHMLDVDYSQRGCWGVDFILSERIFDYAVREKEKKKIAESTDGAEDTQEIDTIETEPTSEKRRKKRNLWIQIIVP
ncbi:Nucleolar protein 58 [Eumeta japonica]|uniref:Nucleolar protein 58 n=1 Tax=Eumeta variegata TaxID=151549 RepID=A0A4C1W916_EUMVA|nr:Nucleolar protein 58 [Eumeta japonica]